jgi:chemotaxis protein MotB
MKSLESKNMLRKPSRAPEVEEVDTEGTWAVSYGDMVTLLLTFFMLFFSLEKPSPSANRMQVSLIEELNTKQVGRAYDNQQPAPSSQAGSSDGKLKMPDLPGEDSSITKVTFPEEFKVSAYEMGDKVLVEFPGVSFFDSSKIDLTRAGVKNLAEFAKVFTRYAGNFYVGIRAYADNRKVRQGLYRFNDNLELSALRSISAMRQLQKSGIPLDRIRTGGFGELMVTAAELERIPPEKRPPQPQHALARKVVLVIEPGGSK